MSKIVIVDYGFCNLDSVIRAVQECGGDAVISDDPRAAASAAKLILPGVGSFAEAMRAIKKQGWDEALKNEVMANGIPLLGICLGMQMLASRGTEGGEGEGLNFIPGKVVKIERTTPDIRIPHVGWNEVNQRQPSMLFDGIPDRKDFYFVHSYHFVPDNKEHILGDTPYGRDVVTVVGNGVVVGTQFHPEKSLKSGFALLRNFIEKF